MASPRDASGRFARTSPEERSPTYQRRIELNLAQGKSYREARGHGVRAADVRLTPELYGSERYERSLRVVLGMDAGLSLTAAAKAEGISPDTVLRYAGAALERDAGGRFRAKPDDRLYRSMQYLGAQGYEWVEPATRTQARKLSAYHNAVDAYLHRGDEVRLRRFRRMRLRLRDGQSLTFITDLDQLDRLAAAGQLHFTSIYRLVA